MPSTVTLPYILIDESLLLPACNPALNPHVTSLISRWIDLAGSDDPDMQEAFSEWKSAFTSTHGELGGQRALSSKSFTKELRACLDSRDPLLAVLALQTFYSFALICLSTSILDVASGDFKKSLQQPTTPQFADLIRSISGGKYSRDRGIKNLPAPPDLQRLLLSDDDILAHDGLQLATAISKSVVTATTNEGRNRDVLKHLYHSLLPSDLRHALGEFFTPDWLADWTLQRCGWHSENEELAGRTFLDPNCGSGTFLLSAIAQLRDRLDKSEIEPADQLNLITQSIRGYDLNPLSVLAAKTNYLLAIAALLTQGEERHLDIPIRCCDSLAPPEEAREDQKSLFDTEALFSARIGGTEVQVPASVVRDQAIEVWLEANAPSLEKENPGLRNIRQILPDLFAPLFDEKVDVVAGNPPWVGWEYLPRGYRDQTKYLWQRYELYDLKGRDAAFLKEDISVLSTYVAVDRYLKPGGDLGFVIRQSVFKSSLGGRGFRNFHLAPTREQLQVVGVDDMVSLQPFEGATTRASVIHLRRGSATDYPVPYHIWRKNVRGRIAQDMPLSEVLERTERSEHVARPVSAADQRSGWITGPAAALKIVESVMGESAYRARSGVFTGGANAVYWMDVLNKTDDGLVRIRNIIVNAKRQVAQVECDIEPDLLFPLARGRDVKPWVCEPSAWILCPHTAETRMHAIALDVMQQSYPRTLSYLDQFRPELGQRKGFAAWEKQFQEAAFYAIQRVGAYTFSEYKVAWRYIASDFITTVIGPSESGPVFPNEKLMMVACGSAEEAYYLCGLLSSSLYRYAVRGLMVQTQIGTHVLGRLNVPKFDASDDAHIKLSALCREGHQDAADGTAAWETNAYSELNSLVVQLVGSSKADLQIIEEELRRA